MGFEFIKAENNGFTEFIWTDNKKYKILYFKPKIQALDDYLPISDKNKMIHYYYNLEISEFSENKWEKVTSIRAFDFPAVTDFAGITEYILSFVSKREKKDKCWGEPLKKVCTKDKNGAKKFSYIKKVCTGEPFGFSEDVYSIEKTFGQKSDSASYIVEAGTCSKRVRIERLSEKDISALLQCLDAFIEYSVEMHNELLVKESELWANQCTVIGDHLYTYDIDYKNMVLTDLNEVFYIGDEVDIDVLFDGLESQKTEKFKYSEIVGINKDSIRIKHKSDELLDIIKLDEKTTQYVYGTCETDIPINKIVYMWFTFDENAVRYSYSADEIANDVFMHLNNEEKADYINLSEEEIFCKYREVIKNRYAMYRNEHGFLDDIENDDNYNENRKSVIYNIVRDIICDIKKLISASSQNACR